MADNDIKYTMTAPASMLYPTVIEPKAYAPKGSKPKPDATKSYSINFYMDPEHADVAGMKKSLVDAAKAKWPGLNIGEEIKAGKLKLPFTTGDKMIEKRNKKLVAAGKDVDDKMDFLKGKVVFKASSTFPIALGVRVKGQGDIDVTNQNKGVHKDAYYNGCLGLGAFTYRAYDAIKEDDNPGVKAYLDMVHSLNTGPHHKISGRSAADTFKGVAGAAVGEDPTAGMEDEIQF